MGRARFTVSPAAQRVYRVLEGGPTDVRPAARDALAKVRGRRRVAPTRTAASLRPYGLTIRDWENMMEAQGGVCLICKKGGKVKNLSIDHSHIAQRKYGIMLVTGLLCARCNTGMGRFDYSVDVLTRQRDYATLILRKLRKLEQEEVIHNGDEE